MKTYLNDELELCTLPYQLRMIIQSNIMKIRWMTCNSINFLIYFSFLPLNYFSYHLLCFFFFFHSILITSMESFLFENNFIFSVCCVIFLTFPLWLNLISCWQMEEREISSKPRLNRSLFYNEKEKKKSNNLDSSEAAKWLLPFSFAFAWLFIALIFLIS